MAPPRTLLVERAERTEMGKEGRLTQFIRGAEFNYTGGANARFWIAD